MSIQTTLDQLHGQAVRNVILQKFTEFSRVILAVGFFAPGLHKLMGIPFTTIPVENPIGAFFNALYQSGFYYRFIGATQVLAAILILFRRTSTLGALIFFGITMNVFVITVSIPFGSGTPVVTGLMFLASLYLVCWDYPKIKPLIPFLGSDVSNQAISLEKAPDSGSFAGRIGYWIFAAAGIILMCQMRGLTLQLSGLRQAAFLTSALGGLVMISGFAADIIRKLKLPVTKPI